MVVMHRTREHHNVPRQVRRLPRFFFLASPFSPVRPCVVHVLSVDCTSWYSRSDGPQDHTRASTLSLDSTSRSILKYTRIRNVPLYPRTNKGFCVPRTRAPADAAQALAVEALDETCSTPDAAHTKVVTLDATEHAHFRELLFDQDGHALTHADTWSRARPCFPPQDAIRGRSAKP